MNKPPPTAWAYLVPYVFTQVEEAVVIITYRLASGVVWHDCIHVAAMATAAWM